MRDAVRPLPLDHSSVEDWPVNVGMVSRLSGLTPKMVRHYEAQGLLGEIRRSGGGYRLYTREDVQTLRFIQRCRSVDFILEDIERLLKMWRSDGEHCADAKALADKHIALMECRIAEMQFMQNALREIVDQCAHGTSCALIDSMAERSAPPRVSPNQGCCGPASGLRNV